MIFFIFKFKYYIACVWDRGSSLDTIVAAFLRSWRAQHPVAFCPQDASSWVPPGKSRGWQKPLFWGSPASLIKDYVWRK